MTIDPEKPFNAYEMVGPDEPKPRYFAISGRRCVALYVAPSKQALSKYIHKDIIHRGEVFPSLAELFEYYDNTIREVSLELGLELLERGPDMRRVIQRGAKDKARRNEVGLLITTDNIIE